MLNVYWYKIYAKESPNSYIKAQKAGGWGTSACPCFPGHVDAHEELGESISKAWTLGDEDFRSKNLCQLGYYLIVGNMIPELTLNGNGPASLHKNLKKHALFKGTGDKITHYEHNHVNL
jgi:hypothetical protein